MYYVFNFGLLITEEGSSYSGVILLNWLYRRNESLQVSFYCYSSFINLFMSAGTGSATRGFWFLLSQLTADQEASWQHLPEWR